MRLQGIQRFGPDFVGLDEAQRNKTWATKTPAYVKTLAPPLPTGGRRDAGTPMENRFEELASILHWVDDQPSSNSPPGTRSTGGGNEIVGARHKDTLRARCLLRRGRSRAI